MRRLVTSIMIATVLHVDGNPYIKPSVVGDFLFVVCS